MAGFKWRGWLAVFVIFIPWSALAQQNEPVEMRAITTAKAATFEQELNEFAKQGFRLEKLFESPTVMNQAAVLTRRVGELVPNFEYKLLGTRRLTTIQKELDEAALQGYEIRGAMAAMTPYLGTDIVLVLERPVGSLTPRFKYSLISTELGKEVKLSESLAKVVADGFRPVKVLQSYDMSLTIFVGVNRSANIIVLARPLDALAAAADTEIEYEAIATQRMATLEKELNQAVGQGFSFYLSSPSRLALMSRRKSQPRPQVEYKLLKVKKNDETEAELVKQAQAGFVYRANFFGNGGVHALLERTPKAKAPEDKLEYKICRLPFRGKGQEQFQKELDQALAMGFRFLDLVAYDKVLLVRAGKTS